MERGAMTAYPDLATIIPVGGEAAWPFNVAGGAEVVVATAAATNNKGSPFLAVRAKPVSTARTLQETTVTIPQGTAVIIAGEPYALAKDLIFRKSSLGGNNAPRARNMLAGDRVNPAWVTEIVSENPPLPPTPIIDLPRDRNSIGRTVRQLVSWRGLPNIYAVAFLLQRFDEGHPFGISQAEYQSIASFTGPGFLDGRSASNLSIPLTHNSLQGRRPFLNGVSAMGVDSNMAGEIAVSITGFAFQEQDYIAIMELENGLTVDVAQGAKIQLGAGAAAYDLWTAFEDEQSGQELVNTAEGVDTTVLQTLTVIVRSNTVTDVSPGDMMRTPDGRVYTITATDRRAGGESSIEARRQEAADA